MLVTGIRSFEANKLSVEPDDLPVDSTIAETSKLVSLPERSGAVIKFASATRLGTSAIVILRNSKGEFLPPGSTLELQSSENAAVVGYDGEAFMTNLGSQNVIAVNTGDYVCHASFSFQQSAVAQPRIGPVDCL